MLTPAPNGWFNPGPFPPTYQTFPFSDAAHYDLQSQFALLGQGLDNGGSPARPAYPAFLVLIHVLTGQDYDRNMNLQAAILGVFPALVYVLGRLLVSRGAGIAAAALAAMRGVNAISGTALLNLANAKQMLPDFPTAIGIALALILCILWFQAPRKLHLPLLTGGAIALSVYLRPTVLGIIPPIILLAGFACRHLPRKLYATGLALLLAGYVATSFPWELRGQIIAGSFTAPSSVTKILKTLQHRFGAPRQMPRNEQQPPVPSARDPSPTTAEPGPSGDEAVDTGDLPRARRFQDRNVRLDSAVIGNHFLHNLVTSVMILPTSLQFDDLQTTVKEGNSYWRSRWDGGLSAGQFLLLTLNLGWLALGVTAAVRRNVAAGLLPAGVFLGYQVVNALGRTSGGRYIVPVDWIIALYFAMGTLEAALWLLQPPDLKQARVREGREAPELPEGQARPERTLLLATVGLMMAGALLIVPDLAFPALFERRTAKELASQASAIASKRSSDWSDAYVSDLLFRGSGAAASGKILYPRSSSGNANGEFYFESSRTTITYPLSAFTLIGPGGEQEVRLAGNLSSGLQNYDDAFVFGCADGDRMEAVFVLTAGPRPAILAREPRPLPQCPLPELVCDGNGNCR